MSNNKEELIPTLHTFGIEWNPLYENVIKTKPYYFGIYNMVYKPGFITAEKYYLKRLQHLVNYIDNIDVNNAITRQCIEKIRNYYKLFNSKVDFNSEVFRTSSRDLIKPLSRLTRTRKNTAIRGNISEPLLSDEHKNVLTKFCHQLNPNNYFYPYLTHFFYVTEEKVHILLVNDSKRKLVRRLDAVGELINYISSVEMPRRKYRNALSFRYLICENNPGKRTNQTLIFSATNYDAKSGAGVKQLWQKDANEKWKHIENLVHWRK